MREELVGGPGNLFEGSRRIEIILFLHRHPGPVTTKRVMAALQITNWKTAGGALRGLEAAGLLTLEERRVDPRGRYRAKFWQPDPKFGVKMASTLEEAVRCAREAAESRTPSEERNRRRAIMEAEAPAELLAALVQRVAPRSA